MDLDIITGEMWTKIFSISKRELATDKCKNSTRVKCGKKKCIYWVYLQEYKQGVTYGTMGNWKAVSSLKINQAWVIVPKRWNTGTLCTTFRQLEMWESPLSSAVGTAYITLVQVQNQPYESDKFQRLPKCCELFASWVVISFLFF